MKKKATSGGSTKRGAAFATKLQFKDPLPPLSAKEQKEIDSLRKKFCHSIRFIYIYLFFIYIYLFFCDYSGRRCPLLPSDYSETGEGGQLFQADALLPRRPLVGERKR